MNEAVPWREDDMSDATELEKEHLREIREFKKFWRNTVIALLIAGVGQIGVGAGALLYMGMLLKQVDVTTALSVKNSNKIEEIYGEQQKRTEIINEARNYLRSHK